MSVLMGGAKPMRAQVDQQATGLHQELVIADSEVSSQKELEERNPQFWIQKKISEPECKLVKLTEVQKV